MYSELLKLCGFEEEEIERERPRIDRAFEKLEIGPEDVARGERRIREFFDIELVGMRKVLRIYMKDLIDIVLAKEEGKRIVYITAPAVAELNIISALVSEDIYSLNPEVVYDHTMGQIFDKLTPVLEAAEKDLLPPGLANCSFLQARLGGLLKGTIPMPDLLWSCAFFCDQAAKLDELTAERYGVRFIHLNHNKTLRGDGDYWKMIDLAAREYFGNEIRNNFSEFQEWAGFQIPEDRIKKDLLPPFYTAYSKIEKIINLLRNADPLPISIVSFEFIDQAQRCYSRVSVRELPAAMDILYDELQERVEKGVGVMEKGAPRVYFTNYIMTDPSIARMIEDAGMIAIPNSNWPSEANRLSVVATKGRDIWEEMAGPYVGNGLLHCGLGAAKATRELCKEWKVDGVILANMFSCRPINIWQMYTKELLEKEDIPVMFLESCDWCDTRDYSAERMRTSIQTFAELLKSRKVAKT